MPAPKSVIYNPYNPQTEEENNYQVAQIGSFKIAFRTMPQDLKFLTTKQKQAGLPALGKIRLESVNISEEAPRKPAVSAPEIEKPASKTAVASYKEAKSLYSRALYNEAIERFIEVLDVNPSHWRAKWYLHRAKKKLTNIQKYPLKSRQNEKNRKKELTEELKQEQKKQKQIIAKLETETRAKKEAEAKAKIEAESRERVSKELEFIEQEKTAAIAQAQQAQTGLEKIRQEAEEKTKQEFAQKFKIEEEQIKQEQEARHKLEAELIAAEQEKKKMEEEIAREREALLESQQAITQQLAAMGQPEMPGSQYIPQEQPAPAPLEPAYTAPIYAPSPLIPIPRIEEPKISIAARITELAKPLLFLKTTKVIGAAVGLGAIAVGLIYFTGLYKIFSPSPQPAQPEIRQEKVLPAALFTINQTETIVLKAGQKKNLFQEINKIAEKSQTPGSFTRILVKFVNEDQQQKYASLVDLIDSLQIVFPSEVLSNMNGDYTLFLYAQKETLDSPFLASLGENKLGLIMTFREPSKIAGQFIDWQSTMAVDLDALFLGKKISFGSNYQFQEFSYNGILIHSLNLPNQYSSLNYALTSNKALIATSLENAQILIDRLVPAK